MRRSGRCDSPDEENRLAEGRVVALDPAAGAQKALWVTVPGPDNMGGVWGWGGVSVEPYESAVYTAIGNSTVLEADCSCVVDDAGFGDSVVRLTADLVATLFQPSGCPPLAAANNKDGFVYVWNRSELSAGPIYDPGRRQEAAVA